MTKRAKKRIIFLCTGNSCRSQMAEGFARALGGDAVEVDSAGTHPIGVHPRAIQAMKELGIDISGQTSKGIDKQRIKQTDLLITLCGHARDRCPVPPPDVQSIHWPVQDPFGAMGTEGEIQEEFRRVRDDIKVRVENLLKEMGVRHG